MAAALSSTNLLTKVRQRAKATLPLLSKYIREILGWFVPMFVTAAATAWLSYEYNQKSNAALVAQQQTFSDLQAFRISGAELDQSLGMYSDALVDGEEVKAAQSKMRNALSRHISDAMGAEKALGTGAQSYIRGLSELRLTVDQVDRDIPETGVRLWEKSLKLMSERRKLLTAAQAKAGEL